MTHIDKEVYYVSYVNFDSETGLPAGSFCSSYEDAVKKATKSAANDEEYDAFYVFKGVAKVQNTPPTLPVTTL